MKKTKKLVLVGLASLLSFSVINPILNTQNPTFADSAKHTNVKQYTTFNITVQKGDTLNSLAKKYGVTVDEIKKTNNLKSTTLKAGQKLTINKVTVKAIEKHEIYYPVQKGDKLVNIAQSFGVTTDELIRKNPKKIKNNVPIVGQELVITTTKNTTEVIYYKKYTSLKKQYGGKFIYYTVQKEERLVDIAKRYNTSVNVIKVNNSLKSTTIKPGDKLIIIKGLNK